MTKNLAASVRQRLMNLARTREEEFGLVLTCYGIERLLYRLSQSEYRNAFPVDPRVPQGLVRNSSPKSSLVL